MDGRNCTGRRISLLNDSFSTKTLTPLDPQPLLASKFSSSSSKSSSSISTTSTFWSSNRPIRAHPDYSRSYSSSTTASEPPTPLLVRSESTDSISQRTPSPLTPNISLERLSIMSGAQGQASYGKSPYGDPDQLAAATILPYTLYPSGAAVPQPYPTHLPQSNPSPPPSIPQTAVRPLAVPIQQSQSQPQQQQQQRPALVQQTSSYRSRRAPIKSSKNTYPCPLGIQFSCDRYFTTSGHAARHAKIHSGEKNIQCPECDKKFARKDNMDQHRKTHRRTGGGMDSDNAQDLSEVDSTIDDEHRSELKASAKLRRARKRNMRSPEPSSLGGLRTESDESLSTSHTTDSEGPYADEKRQRRHQRPRTSSNGSNSLDVLANVALGRGVYDSDT